MGVRVGGRLGVRVGGWEGGPVGVRGRGHMWVGLRHEGGRDEGWMKVVPTLGFGFGFGLNPLTLTLTVLPRGNPLSLTLTVLP